MCERSVAASVLEPRYSHWPQVFILRKWGMFLSVDPIFQTTALWFSEDRSQLLIYFFLLLFLQYVTLSAMKVFMCVCLCGVIGFWQAFITSSFFPLLFLWPNQRSTACPSLSLLPSPSVSYCFFLVVVAPHRETCCWRLWMLKGRQPGYLSVWQKGHCLKW